MSGSYWKAEKERLYELEHRIFALETSAFERDYLKYLARIERLENLFTGRSCQNAREA